MTDQTMHNEAAGPGALQQGGHWPAGWVSPEFAEKAQREVHRQQIAAEREAAGRDDLEAEVDRRLAEARGLPQEPVAEPEVKSEAAK